MVRNIETAKAFIEAANNIVQSLAEVNPRDDEFDSLLLKHERICRTALQYMDLQERVAFFLGEMMEIEKGDEEGGEEGGAPTVKVTPIAEKKSSRGKSAKAKTEPAEEHPVEQPFPEPEAEKSKPEPTISTEEEKPLTLAEVKAAFTAAAKSGVKVAEIINDTGYAKLSEIPDYLYPALMRSLERKKAGEE